MSTLVSTPRAAHRPPLLDAVPAWAWLAVVVTAEASAWLLRIGGWVVERSGTALQVDGHLVIVDAPCSGVQMAWMAYFCACTVAVISGVADRRWLRRLPWVGVVVLAGNVVR